MNREMRRLMEREERLQKAEKSNGGSAKAARRPRPGVAGAPIVERKPIWVRLGTFFHEVRQELKKVSWPSREQLIAFTAICLVVIVVLTLVIFSLDIAMKEAVISLLTNS
jgi:preprotein translocase subunit SecE